MQQEQDQDEHQLLTHAPSDTPQTQVREKFIRRDVTDENLVSQLNVYCI